jgi:hypothetical protein
MNILNFFLLIAAHYFLGWGILKALKVKPSIVSLEYTFVSILLGLGCFCLLPPILEMLRIPIHTISLAAIILAVCSFPIVIWIKDARVAPFRQALKAWQNAFKLYDLVFLGIIAYVLYVGMFKCFYYPPTPRDFTSGAEAIAEFTLKEQHINNSYFTVDLFSTDNYQKPPFLLGLQIIYKAFVQPFGQVWLIPLAVSFILLFYLLSRKLVHPVFAAMATILMLITPEFYAYVIIMPLFDFPNTVYLFIGYYYLYRFSCNEERKYLMLSATGFALATVARPETVLLAGLTAAAYYCVQVLRSKKLLRKETFVHCCILVLFPLLADIFTMEIFVKHFIPSSLSISGKINPELSDLSPLFDRLSMLINAFMFPHVFPSRYNVSSAPIYGETFNLMALFIIAEIAAIIITRKLDYRAASWFLFMVLVFTFLGCIGYLLLWTNHFNAKRGVFKLIPLVYFFILNTRLVRLISGKLQQWEGI